MTLDIFTDLLSVNQEYRAMIFSQVPSKKFYCLVALNMLCCAQLLSDAQLFAILWTVVHQTPLSVGFSRQEYWSGLSFFSSGDLPDAGIKPRYPMLQTDSLPAEPPGKPMNTGVGSLSLPLRIFPTQELNWRLLHGRQILYQQGYQGSPKLSLGYLQYLKQCKCCVTSCQHVANSSVGFWNFLELQKIFSTLVG